MMMMMMTSNLVHHCKHAEAEVGLAACKTLCHVSTKQVLSDWVACRLVVWVNYPLTCSILGPLTKGIS